MVFVACICVLKSICICRRVYLCIWAHMGLRLVRLGQQLLAAGRTCHSSGCSGGRQQATYVAYICSRNRELTRNVFIFLKYCHVYFLHSVNHISLFLKLVELRGGGMKLHSRNGEPRIDEKCFCEKWGKVTRIDMQWGNVREWNQFCLVWKVWKSMQKCNINISENKA